MNEVVAAYWRDFRRADRGDETDSWAWEYVDDAVRRGDPGVVNLLVELADAVADDDEALAYLGAGPLEDLLCAYGPAHALRFVEEVEANARSSRALRGALRSVWWADNAEPSVVRRLVRVVERGK